MIEWLNIHVDNISLLWLLPILFMFHDFEEILIALPYSLYAYYRLLNDGIVTFADIGWSLLLVLLLLPLVLWALIKKRSRNV